uniref:Uncharacterized protein n=1 Tax=Glossina pallidipes TaxID=7398 RepID=A0A1A9ZBD4_GLOPL
MPQAYWLVIRCSYISPSSDISAYLEDFRLISDINSELKSNNKLIIMGDSDLPFITPILCPGLFTEFFDVIFELCLYQLNNVYNLLSFLFSNEKNRKSGGFPSMQYDDIESSSLNEITDNFAYFGILLLI